MSSIDSSNNQPRPSCAQRQRHQFAVLVAAYNHSQFIERTLDSVAAQTHIDFQLVVVDDGSTDDTHEVVERWLAGHTGIASQLLRIENSGQSAALEAAFEASNGEWIALLDSDDVWQPTKLEAVAIAFASSPNAGMIVHPLLLMDEMGNQLPGQRPLRARLTEGDAREAVRRTARQVAPPTSGVTIHRDVFASLIPMPTRDFKQAADAYLTLGASLRTPIRAIQEPLGRYRINGGSQYLQRLSTADGLERTVAIHRRIVSALGIRDAYQRNSYFMRMEFARAKLRESWPSSVNVVRKLVKAVLTDTSFSMVHRLALSLFWILCAALPRRSFRELWSWFVRVQAGQRQP